MTTFPFARAAGVLFLTVGLAISGLAWGSSPSADKIPDLVAVIFQGVPQSDHMTIVLKDDRDRLYRAFYLSTYADVKELRAYVITYRNVKELPDELGDVDELLAAGNVSEAFDKLIAYMRLDLGSAYISDVGLDGIHDEDVSVGMGHMRDRYHQMQFASSSEADATYTDWLEKAAALRSASS